MQALINHLYGLADGTIKPNNTAYGLCYEISKCFPEHLNTVKKLFPHWSKFSGEIQYPVPHPYMSYFAGFNETDDLWADDEYGDNRRDLCRFCAQRLEKRLKDKL